MIRAARLVSFIFHPLLFPTYLTVLLSMYVPHFVMIRSEAMPSFVGLVFVMTFLLPAINMLMFKVFGTIRSLEMETRQERLLPFVLITLIYLVVAFMFYYKIGINLNFNRMMAIIAALVLMATLFTIFMKVSIHSLAMGGACGILLPLNRAVDDGSMVLPTAIVILLAGVVMSARLLLNKHTPREVMYGVVSGFTLAFLGMRYLFQ